jgi:DNA-binding response OmpR family regulator
MPTILIIDVTTTHAAAGLAKALEAAKFQVQTLSDPAKAKAAAADADAIVLAASTGQLATALPQATALRGSRRTPILLATDLATSHWDETFGMPEALDVDALLGLPIDTAAMVQRIEGILEARASVGPHAPVPGMKAIIERAIANEEAAEAFYRRAAAAVGDPETKEILSRLADEEKEHRDLLVEFRRGSRPLPPSPSVPPSLVDSLGCPNFTPDLKPPDAFLLAACKERLAVRFYEDWAKLYPPGAERELLDELAGVERRHQEHVEGMFSNASFPESWE